MGISYVNSKYWWVVFVIAAAVLDGLTYFFKQQAVVPISVFDVYREYNVNHQALGPMLFGPFITLMGSYLIACVLVK